MADETKELDVVEENVDLDPDELDETFDGLASMSED